MWPHNQLKRGIWCVQRCVKVIHIIVIWLAHNLCSFIICAQNIFLGFIFTRKTSFTFNLSVYECFAVFDTREGKVLDHYLYTQHKIIFWCFMLDTNWATRTYVLYKVCKWCLLTSFCVNVNNQNTIIHYTGIKYIH